MPRAVGAQPSCQMYAGTSLSSTSPAAPTTARTPVSGYTPGGGVGPVVVTASVNAGPSGSSASAAAGDASAKASAAQASAAASSAAAGHVRRRTGRCVCIPYACMVDASARAGES